MKQNYALLSDKILSSVKSSGTKPTLLLQACCAPCSSYVLEYLSELFDITLFFYNPNISPESEFLFRLRELERFTTEAGYNKITVLAPQYDPHTFFDRVRGLEDLPEGGERCRICYELRLRKTAETAKAGNYDYFCTTLSISPYKNAEWLNEIGLALAEEIGGNWLVSDFKKKNGYKRSIELSKEYSLYRQNYCGCVHSKAEAERRQSTAKQLSES